MRSSIYRPIIPFLVRGAIVALLVMIAGGLLSGPAGFGPEPQSAEAALLSEVKKLLASDAGSGDRFGLSGAISGDTAVVGAYLEDAGGSDAGAAYVFQRDEGGAGNWGEVKKLTASDAQAGDNFGISVAVSGDTAVVGARFEDAGGSQAGAAYVFQRDQGGADNWGEVKKLTASDAQAGDRFGVRVSISGDTAIVGTTFAEAAYVFQRNEGGADNWGEVKRLTASDAQAGDRFGVRVSISGDTAVVGADLEDAGGSDAGAAYVFQRDQGGAGNWGEVTKLLASDAEASDGFGGSVAVSGDTAVVGATGEDAVATFAGAAYVFQRDQGGADNWGEVKKLTASDAGTGDLFGGSVAVSGDTAVVGATAEDAGGAEAGAAYVFQRNQGGAGNWGELKKLLASDAQAADSFGWSVAISGDTAVLGAIFEDAGGTDAGAAYVFEEPDADNDGLPDSYENKHACLDPLVDDAAADPDGDGRTNQEEFELGSNPCVANVVGGIAELAEVAGTPLETDGSSGGGAGTLAGMIAALVAGTVALGGAAWFARRRWAK